jgi:acyl-CoA synthetase (AMP-forming)/AMP-acid ligase II
LDVVEELRPQLVFLVPSMAQLIVAHPRFAGAELSSVLICAVGSAPLAPSTLRALQERMPEAAVSNSYGMTEAGQAFCAMGKGESLEHIGSVGKPMAPLEVRIVDEGGRDLPPGEVGEALLRLPGRHREYYRDPEATASTWNDGWLRTGDLACLDGDGYLYIVGRKKDVIIRGGNNVHAADIEAVLCEHPGVLEAAVVGIPHEVLGEDLAAVVVLAPGTPTTADQLREHCATRMADYKVPRSIEITDELPKNATGKVLKAQLRAGLNSCIPTGRARHRAQHLSTSAPSGWVRSTLGDDVRAPTARWRDRHVRSGPEEPFHGRARLQRRTAPAGASHRHRAHPSRLSKARYPATTTG